MKHNHKNEERYSSDGDSSLVPPASCSLPHVPRYMLRRSGYIAIMSALIITAMITIILVSLSQASFLQRINISDTHLKEKSRALAQTCVNAALLKLASSSSYAGNEIIVVAGDACRIISVISSSTGRIISAQGQYLSSYTNLQVTVTTGTLSIIGSQEVKNF